MIANVFWITFSLWVYSVLFMSSFPIREMRSLLRTKGQLGYIIGMLLVRVYVLCVCVAVAGVKAVPPLRKPFKEWQDQRNQPRIFPSKTFSTARMLLLYQFKISHDTQIPWFLVFYHTGAWKFLSVYLPSVMNKFCFLILVNRTSVVTSGLISSSVVFYLSCSNLLRQQSHTHLFYCW